MLEKSLKFISLHIRTFELNYKTNFFFQLFHLYNPWPNKWSVPVTVLTYSGMNEMKFLKSGTYSKHAGVQERVTTHLINHQLNTITKILFIALNPSAIVLYPIEIIPKEWFSCFSIKSVQNFRKSCNLLMVC